MLITSCGIVFLQGDLHFYELLQTFFGLNFVHAVVFYSFFLKVHLCLLIVLLSAHLIHYFDTFSEVKVVVVFDAMMSGLPTHKEVFEG